MSKVKKFRRVSFLVRVNAMQMWDEIVVVKAYYFGRGIFVHRPVISVKGLYSYLVSKTEEDWTVSAQCGWKIIDLRRTTLELIGSKIHILQRMDWSQMSKHSKLADEFQMLRDEFKRACHESPK